MSFYARSKPYSERKQCQRCGIEPETRKSHSTGYCSDCSQFARQLGWID